MGGVAFFVEMSIIEQLKSVGGQGFRRVIGRRSAWIGLEREVPLPEIGPGPFISCTRRNASRQVGHISGKIHTGVLDHDCVTHSLQSVRLIQAEASRNARRTVLMRVW